jgi:uncharacterized membrane-anchored protein YhcB (DUF1043 family)
MPLMMACFVGGMIGFIIVRLIGNENEADRKTREAREIVEGRRFK